MNENADPTEEAEASETVYISISALGVSGPGRRVRRKEWMREQASEGGEARLAMVLMISEGKLTSVMPGYVRLAIPSYPQSDHNPSTYEYDRTYLPLTIVEVPISIDKQPPGLGKTSRLCKPSCPFIISHSSI
jgi:hypothetical protein